MKRSTAPYGEARRLRYFVLICSGLLQSPSVDMDFLIDRLLDSVKTINTKLDDYIRNTGILRSRAVARNYLRFAGWLNFLRIDNLLIVPNSFTVFFANLQKREDFFLTREEKIAFFLHLIKLDEVYDLLRTLKVRNAIKDFIRSDLSEHFVESFFEWFVDLGVLKPTSPSFGRFNLTALGYHTSEPSKSDLPRFEIIGSYITNLVNSPISLDFKISNDELWASFQESLQKLSRYVRSEVDPYLYSVFPLVLDLQIRLILDHHLLVSASQLIHRLKDISADHNTLLSWDTLTNSGYLKIQR